MTIHTLPPADFALYESVYIKAIGDKAIISSIRLDSRGVAYLVAFWMDGKRIEEWVHDFELTRSL